MKARRWIARRGDDVIEVTRLEDGTVRTDVKGEVSFTNHGSAEEALSMVEKLLGGETVIEKQGHAEHHHGISETHKHSH